jgi:hypothetical protein
MATYFYDKDGNNSDGLTWAKAFTTFAGAIAAASGGTDVVVVNKAGVADADEELGADVTWATANSVRIISATRSGDGTDYTPSAMGTDYWFGNSTTNRFIKFNAGADDRVYVYGVTLRTAGSTADDISLNSGNTGGELLLENCYLWNGNTGSTQIIVGANTSSCHTELVDCTIRLGAVGQAVKCGGGLAVFRNCTLSSAGSAPTVLTTVEYGGTEVLWQGCDLSHVTGTLVGNASAAGKTSFVQCKLGAGVTILATQTSNPTRASQSVWLVDCASGDTHIVHGYYDAIGSCIRETSLYYTGSEAGNECWKIVTSANASYYNPFYTPWVDLYNTGTSAITPRFEILRDGSTTAYQDDEIWAEFQVKSTSGSTIATRSTDKCTLANKLAGTTADQTTGAGYAAWYNQTSADWSGKVDSGSAVTPAEIGYIRGRVVVGEPSITVYVDPVIRTA